MENKNLESMNEILTLISKHCERIQEQASTLRVDVEYVETHADLLIHHPEDPRYWIGLKRDAEAARKTIQRAKDLADGVVGLILRLYREAPPVHRDIDD